MFRRLQISLIAFATSIFGTACAASYDVVRSAEPSPFSCNAEFVVLPIAYDSLQVGKKTEADYLFTKSPETQKRWEQDKRAIDREFHHTLITQANERGVRVQTALPAGEPDAFVIRPVISVIEPGFFAGPAMHASEVLLTVQILTPDGRLLDEIDLESETMGSIVHPTTRSRFESDAEKLGEAVAEYLDTRTKAARERRTAKSDAACAAM